MIVLCNLNKYIGGGETLLIRFAKHLQSNNIPYIILAMGGDCWIFEQAKKMGLPCLIWPSNNDSISYANNAERERIISKLNLLFCDVSKEFRIFTFCMRDLHNALYVFSRTPNIQVTFSHGIFHNEDIRYLASLSFWPNKFIRHNRALMNQMHKKKSVLFFDPLSKNHTLGSSLPNDDYKFIPLPIELDAPIHPKKLLSNKHLRIICISRFVSFKIAAILSLVRYARNRDDIHLTIIGYGPWKILLIAWLRFYKLENVSLQTNVQPFDLASHIDRADIGYAQGTSILEIARRGIPVLIAPYSKIRDLFDAHFPTLGVFGETQSLGNVNDISDHQTYSIAESVERIKSNYDFYIEGSIRYLRSFSADLIFREMIELIENSKFNNQGLKFQPLHPPLLKRVIKKMIAII